MMTILAVDLGTSALKTGVYHFKNDEYTLIRNFSQDYRVNTYNNGQYSDIEPGKWQQAFMDSVRALGEFMPEVDLVALSGTTPGLNAMDGEGNSLYPAILMTDQRSRLQARRIIEIMSLDYLLSTTGNMPVAGGCSLASILWIKDNHPEIFKRTAVFGHSNTFLAKWLTGRFCIDPSSASLTALYNTVSYDFDWNRDICKEFDLSVNRLPSVIPAYASAGRVKDSISATMGMRKRPEVLIGGNDAVLAAYSSGVQEAGQIINVNGTCEITLVCLPKCYPSQNYNVRTHVIPGRWLTLYVMNAEGAAFEWFRSVFCADMNQDEFYKSFMPRAVDEWLTKESDTKYIPFLMGSRYSQDDLKAQFLGLTSGTTREELLAALVRGLCEYQGKHLDDISQRVPLREEIIVAGGATSPSLVRAKENWMRRCRYVYREHSSLEGTAILARLFESEVC